MYAKNSRLQDASLVSLFGKTIGFFCLVRSTTDCRKSRRVFCIRFNWKTKRKPAEKNTGLCLSIKSETTCKNSAHLDEKKNRPKFDIEWLCSKVFNSLKICGKDVKIYNKLKQYSDTYSDTKRLIPCFNPQALGISVMQWL